MRLMHVTISFGNFIWDTVFLKECTCHVLRVEQLRFCLISWRNTQLLISAYRHCSSGYCRSTSCWNTSGGTPLATGCTSPSDGSLCVLSTRRTPEGCPRIPLLRNRTLCRETTVIYMQLTAPNPQVTCHRTTRKNVCYVLFFIARRYSTATHRVHCDPDYLNLNLNLVRHRILTHWRN